jgi:hypothetical protein
MKKSELKSYIRETVISELSPQDIAAQKSAQVAANKSVQDLNKKVSSTTEPTSKKAALDSLNAAKTRLQQITQKIAQKQPVPVDMLPENEDDFDAEPTAKDIAANSSIAKLQSKYGEVVKQMKSVVNKYKSAESSEKQKYVDQLRNLTKIKKEIEAMINPSMDDEEEI